MNLLQFIPRPIRVRLRASWLAFRCWKIAREFRGLKIKYENQAGRVHDRSTR